MSLAYRLQKWRWDLASNLLVRPFVVVALGVGLGTALPACEAVVGTHPLFAAVRSWIGAEPGSAQVLLATLAGAMATVVSMVYSILLVALSLASMQFSTRILANFVRDARSQWTLGLLVGTFAYCLVVLRSIRTDPPWVPSLSVSVAVALALVALGALIWFIDHIARGIQANHLVDRIAEGSERAVDDLHDELAVQGTPLAAADRPALDITVRARASGYVQLVDTDALAGVAREGWHLALVPAVGQFVARGAVLARAAPARADTAAGRREGPALPPALENRVHDAVDIGPERTNQQDAAWGFRQIVDIALKAISPAVNDPSTACTCMDHLGRLLLHAEGRLPAQGIVGVGTGSVEVRVARLEDLVDLSFEQIRQYGASDLAVSLRMLRVMGDVAERTEDPGVRARIGHHARLLVAKTRSAHVPADCDELDRRMARVEEALGG